MTEPPIPLTVVLGSLRNDDKVTSLDRLLLAANDGLADTGSEDQVLVDTVNLASVRVREA